MTSATAAASMDQTKDQMQPKSDNLKPEISPEAQQQQQEAGVPPAKPTGTLQDLDPNALMEKRNQVGAAAAAAYALLVIVVAVACVPGLTLLYGATMIVQCRNFSCRLCAAAHAYSNP